MGALVGSVIFYVFIRVKKESMVGKGVFLKRKETRVRLDRIEVGGRDNSKWMGQQRKTNVGRSPPLKHAHIHMNLVRIVYGIIISVKAKWKESIEAKGLWS